MEHLGNDTDRGKPKYWKRNSVSTPFYLPQIYKYSSSVHRYGSAITDIGSKSFIMSQNCTFRA